MARVFLITAATTSLQLDGNQKAQASFTVSNSSGRPLRGRAFARAASPAQAWLHFAGDEERSFPVGGTQQLSVNIAVPPGSPPGKYSFRVDVASAENPDEDFAEGPTISFDVTAAPVKKPFPWWIVIVAAVVLLAFGGLVTWMLSGREPAPATTESADPAAAPATLAKRFPVQHAPGWVDYRDLHRDDPANYAGVSVAKAGEICVVQGMVQAWGPAGILGQPHIATLPVECRPKEQMIFNLNNHANTARIDVYPDGRMVWAAGGTDSGWISLTGITFGTGQFRPIDFGATWTNYGAPFAGGLVRKQGGVCVVEGLVRTLDPAGVAARPQIASLPQDCRPRERIIFNLSNHARTARVDVLPDGQVNWFTGGADHQWISLSGMVFALGESKPLELGPSWANYGASFAPPVIRMDGGLCVAEGLVRIQDPGGTMGRPHVATLPPECRPKDRLVFNFSQDARTQRVDVLPNGQVMWVAGGTEHGWVSLNAIVLAPEGPN